MKFSQWAAVASVCVLSTALPVQATTQVDLELALLVDASRSVTAEKFVMQRDGYVNLFTDDELFFRFMREGKMRRVAVTLIYWSSPKKGHVAVDWQVIDSAEGAKTFAAAVKAAVPFNAKLEAGTKPFDGTTAPGSALSFALTHYQSGDITGQRQVIVISGDGIENDGLSTAKLRDEALKQGVDAINTLPIGSPGLKNWYVQNLQAGATGFTVAAQDYPDLASALQVVLKRTLDGAGTQGVPQ